MTDQLADEAVKALPDEIQVWRSTDTLDHIGTWATTRYPPEAVTYVRKADAQAAHECGMDAAADKILDWLAKAVGAKEYTACEGSETWDGDVQGTIYAILKAGNVYDDEDGRVAKLADAQPAVALVVEDAIKQLAAARETFCYASTGSDEEFTSLLLGFDTAAGIIRALADADALAALTSAQGGSPLTDETPAQHEERTCTCGAGHGSLEGHTDWCDFTAYQSLKALASADGLADVEALRKERDAAREALMNAGIGLHVAKREAAEAVAERDRLSAANKALEDRVARLVGAITLALSEYDAPNDIDEAMSKLRTELSKDAALAHNGRGE